MRCLGWLSSWICEDAIAVHNMISGQAWHVRRNEEVQFRGERAVLRSWKLTVVVLLGLIVLRKVRSYSWGNTHGDEDCASVVAEFPRAN